MFQLGAVRTRPKGISAKQSATPERSKSRTPSTGPAQILLNLQQIAGNGAVRALLRDRLIQPKLRVGLADNEFERQADRAASQVMRAPASLEDARSLPADKSPESFAQGNCASCEREETVRRQPDGQTSAPTQAAAEGNPPAGDVARLGVQSAGTPLSAAQRAFYESRFGHDLRNVRVHADPGAAESAAVINARAFTYGSHIVFGAGEHRSDTTRGRSLMAHELTHVIQQRTGAAQGIQRAPLECTTAKRTDVEADIRAKVGAAGSDPAALPDLYLALKRARSCFSNFDEAAFLALVPTATTIYTNAQRKSARKGHSKAVSTDDRKLAWEESLKPFAGYFLSGFDTANRLLTGDNQRRLGGSEAPSHKPWREFAEKQNESDKRAEAQQAFSEANVLVFSGHQYAQYKLPGVWNTGDWNKMLDVRGIQGPLHNVKLLISTSCATLCKEAYDVWKGIFPNAVFLGAAKSTPLKGSLLANAFVRALPSDLLFEPGASGTSGAISAWKSAVEKTQSSDVRGGVLDIAAGTVELWFDKKWNSMSASAPDNKCHVKGDYSGPIPDPRGP